MARLRVLLSRLLAPLTRRRWETQLDDELATHLDLETDHLIRQGLAPAEARREARRRLGNVPVTRERYRDQKGLPVLDALAQDIRYSLRLLVKDRAFTAVAVATLALGIGANTAIFSVVNGVLLDPLPYPDSDRIVTVWEDFSAVGGPEREWVEVPNYVEWKQATDVFETLALYTFGPVNLTGQGDPQQIASARVSHDFFDTFGVAPTAGRGFTEAEDRPGGPAVAVISDAFHQRTFAGAADATDVVGRILTINGEPVEIIGVLPAGFEPPLLPPADIWLPVAVDATTAGRGNFFVQGVGRLAEGATVERARARLDAMMARIGQAFPENRGVTTRVIPLLDLITTPVRAGLWVLLGLVALVLLIACANIANLMLSRGATRRREFAVRAAVGAGRGRLVRQLLTESVVLSAMGGAAGIALAHWGTQALIAQAPAGAAPRLDNVGIDLTVLGFTLALAVLAGVAFGLAPAIQARRRDVVGALKDGGRGTDDGATAGRLRGMLVAGQVALALCLLIAAGLTVRSFVTLLSVDPGFSPDGLTTAFVRIPPDQAAGAAELVLFMDELLARVAAHDGVEAVAAVSVLPFSGTDSDTGFTIEGRPDLDVPGQEPTAWYRRVTPSYFGTMGIEVVDGREFTADDRASSAPVVMVSEATAARFWPGERAVGKRIRFGPESPWATIVGVVRGVRYQGLDSDPRPELYLPFDQRPGRAMTVVVRTALAAGAIADMLRADLREVNAGVPLSNVGAMSDLVAASTASPRFFRDLTSIFGALALALAAVGLYGVMSYTVSRRTTEMGVRLALGASRGNVLSLIVSQGLVLTLAGLAIGFGVALWAAGLLDSLLFGIGARDVPTFAGAAAVLVGVALVACLIPAFRATRIDPIRALRVE